MSKARSPSQPRMVPLRPFDRIVAGYATSAFALGGGHSILTREWHFALLGFSCTAAGVALLLADHRRWRAQRRGERR
ncbi:MAG: hypothetical protein ABIV10_15520 [Gemmatimonadaceae bacterium]